MIYVSESHYTTGTGFGDVHCLTVCTGIQLVPPCTVTSFTTNRVQMLLFLLVHPKSCHIHLTIFHSSGLQVMNLLRHEGIPKLDSLLRQILFSLMHPLQAGYLSTRVGEIPVG